MEHHFIELRDDRIEKMQSALPELRKFLGLTGQELSEFLGVTRQTVNNLEQKKTRLTATQYVAYAAVLDFYLERHPDDVETLQAIVRRSSPQEDDPELAALEYRSGSFLHDWFSIFPSEDDRRLPEVTEKERLRILSRQYLIFLHTDFLMAPEAENFVQRLAPCMSRAENRAIVPVSVIQELQAKLFSPEESESARKALGLLKIAKQAGILEVFGDLNDPSPAELYHRLFPKLRVKRRIVLLTESSNFAEEIFSFNHTEEGFSIKVAHLNEQGELVMWVPCSGADTSNALSRAEI